MNIFRNKLGYWCFSIFFGFITMIGSYKLAANGSVYYLYQIYERIFVDIVILGLILPVFSLIVLKTVREYMWKPRMLALQSRENWWRKLIKDMIKICTVFSGIILLPAAGIAFIQRKEIRNFAEVLYLGMLILSYILILLLLSLLIVAAKIKWNQDVAVIFVVLVLAFFPNLLSFIFRSYGTPTICEIINSLYAFKDGQYQWMENELVCLCMLFLFWVASKLAYKRIKKQDFL